MNAPPHDHDAEYRLPGPAELLAAVQTRERLHLERAHGYPGTGIYAQPPPTASDVPAPPPANLHGSMHPPGGQNCTTSGDRAETGHVWYVGILAAGILSRVEFCGECGLVRVPPDLLGLARDLADGGAWAGPGG